MTGARASGNTRGASRRDPRCDSGVMDFPDLALPRAGGGSVGRADLAGRPWLVYLARHPG